MTDDVSVQIADAIVATLNDPLLILDTFSHKFTAYRAHVPLIIGECSKQLKVVVLPTSIEEVTASRSTTLDTHKTGIGIIQQCEPDDEEKIDGLKALVNQIRLFVRFREYANAVWIQQLTTLIDPEFIRTDQIFRAVITIDTKIGA